MDTPRTIQVKEIYLHKVKGFPYWPVQVCKVDNSVITLVYYETGETSCGKNFIPFSEQSITDLKLDQIKSLRMLLLLQEPLFECDLLPPFLKPFVV